MQTTKGGVFVKRIPAEHVWHFRKCDGYLDLNMVERARDEMARIPSAYHDTVPYRQLQLRMAMEVEAWTRAAGLAEKLCSQEPGEASHWIQLAYATRRAQGLEEAHAVLRLARDRFPEEAIISFNLACYECQLGRTEQALDYLGEAEALAPQCRDLALQDDDLKPLWDKLQG